MISGAREARLSWFRRLVARAAARELSAFVVPGPELARAHGVDLAAAGLTVVGTPRHARVLVLVGELPESLKRAAAVAYAQMPRPRAILAVGAGDVSPLPEPDVSVELAQEALSGGVLEFRRTFAEGAFGAQTADFDVEAIRTETEYVCPMHPEVVRSEPGSCPICGMDLVPREVAGGEGRGSGGHDDMDHGDDSGFMSMVEMTKDLPRSSDGLQMEWVEAPFGPLFPGLPGGLSLTLTLDGDTVAQAEAQPGIHGWAPEGLAGPVETLPDRLARLDPLSPVAYRVLACRAVGEAAGAAGEESGRAGALERERAASHLNWLSEFGHLLGDRWVARRAARLQLALLRAEDAGEVVRLEAGIREFLGRVERTPLLRRRLRGIGILPGDAQASGPVARAAGSADDARADDALYLGLGFAPVVREGGDALSRLRVRLAEIAQSLELVRAAGSISTPDRPPGPASSGAATVETPRGRATLSLSEGTVVAFELDTPSTGHLDLVRPLAEGEELADALVGISSLDLSPWGVIG